MTTEADLALTGSQDPGHDIVAAARFHTVGTENAFEGHLHRGGPGYRNVAADGEPPGLAGCKGTGAQGLKQAAGHRNGIGGGFALLQRRPV